MQGWRNDMGLLGRWRARSQRGYDIVSPEAAKVLLDAGATLVDVRSAPEWHSGHAPSAIHIPLQLVRRSAIVPPGTPIVTICRSGHRSALAARWFARRGYRVASIDGGLPAWQAAGLPVTARE
jgi:rhodanese-related sulfurtransferase